MMVKAGRVSEHARALAQKTEIGGRGLETGLVTDRHEITRVNKTHDEMGPERTASRSHGSVMTLRPLQQNQQEGAPIVEDGATETSVKERTGRGAAVLIRAPKRFLSGWMSQSTRASKQRT